jgi:hypothetical protein
VRISIVSVLVIIVLGFAACTKEQQEPNLYTKYDSQMDFSKPVAFGEDNNIFVFMGDDVRKQIGPVIDTSLLRKVRLTREEHYFSATPKKIAEIKDLITYKNLLFCGILDGNDDVSAYINASLASEYIAAARKSGGELFVVNNLKVRDQIILYLLAKDLPTLLTLAEERKDQIFDFYLQRYEQRLAYQVYRTPVIESKFFENRPFMIQIPAVYKLWKDEKKGRFLTFIQQPTAPTRTKPDKYVSVYYEPMTENKLTGQWLYDKRQELGKTYLGGDEIFSKEFTAEKTSIAGHQGLRIYGHWINKSHGGFGGAFQTFAFWDQKTQKAYMVDTIVFFPDGDKLPTLLELGMIARTLVVR